MNGRRFVGRGCTIKRVCTIEMEGSSIPEVPAAACPGPRRRSPRHHRPPPGGPTRRRRSRGSGPEGTSEGRAAATSEGMTHRWLRSPHQWLRRRRGRGSISPESPRRARRRRSRPAADPGRPWARRQARCWEGTSNECSLSASYGFQFSVTDAIHTMLEAHRYAFGTTAVEKMDPKVREERALFAPLQFFLSRHQYFFAHSESFGC